MAYTDASGNWTYYTASTTELGKNEVLYIIDPDNINNTLSENNIKYVQQMYALTISDMGMDMLIFPEGVWNKTPEKMLLDFWPGAYRLAIESGNRWIISDMLGDLVLKSFVQIKLCFVCFKQLVRGY